MKRRLSCSGNDKCGSVLRLWDTLLILSSFIIHSCYGHGRLIEPPSRASAWRYGFQTPPDYNDHELYCGGFTRQWKRNGGKCGECGDAWDLAEPRPHENGGQWGQGVIVRSYLPGSEITIRVELTASHMGYFEFRLCPEPSAKQDCLDKNVLKILSGFPAQPSVTDLDYRFYPRNGSRIYDIKARLPEMTCNQCVLQWRYIAGNNWGMCDDGIGAVGCGPQEEFRSCSDIALTTDARTPIRPFRPTFRTTIHPTTSTGSTEQSPVDTTPMSDSVKFTLLLGLGLLLLFILCGLVIWYFYRYKQPTYRLWMDSLSKWVSVKSKNKTALSATIPRKIFSPFVSSNPTDNCKANNNGVAPTVTPSIAEPPVPPPRTKRLARVKDLHPDESSIA